MDQIIETYLLRSVSRNCDHILFFLSKIKQGRIDVENEELHASWRMHEVGLRLAKYNLKIMNPKCS